MGAYKLKFKETLPRCLREIPQAEKFQNTRAKKWKQRLSQFLKSLGDSQATEFWSKCLISKSCLFSLHFS